MSNTIFFNKNIAKKTSVGAAIVFETIKMMMIENNESSLVASVSSITDKIDLLNHKTVVRATRRLKNNRLINIEDSDNGVIKKYTINYDVVIEYI